MNVYDVLIVGSGPAGYTAAIYTARALLKTALVTGAEMGGQLTTTTTVENFPGFENGVTGPELMMKMKKQTENVGAEIIIDTAQTILKSDELFKVVTTEKELFGKSVIVATGASAKWLNLPNEQRLRGKGVSACATCDGFFFRNKIVAVIGAGDAAMEEANFLTKFADKVYLIVRSTPEKVRASKIMQERVKNNSKINILYNSEIKDVLGVETVKGLLVFNNQTGAEQELIVDGLFVAIGHQPNTGFVKDLLAIDAHGYLVLTSNTKTSVEGIFAAGDVADYRYRQAVSAAGSGCQAAIDVIKYLEEKK